MLSGRKPGDRPDDPTDPGATRHVLRLEVSAEALAAFREARRRIELDEVIQREGTMVYLTA